MVKHSKNRLNYAFFGSTNYSKELLLFLINNSFLPRAVFTIPEEFNISYSDKKVKNANFADIEQIAVDYNIDCFEVDSVAGMCINDYREKIESMDLDLILVLGWYYMIPNKIRKLTRYGAWGIHASLLPKYAGGAPLNWAIINGEKESGVTLFRMEDGVDDGDIISQKKFPIDFNDTIQDAYKKATILSKSILNEVLNNIDNITFTPQDKMKKEVYQQRKPEDGEIDLSQDSISLYNFIRAQSEPYPGAFIKTVDGKKLVIEKARIVD